jgi:pyruvate kinase
MNWGVNPVLYEGSPSDEDKIAYALDAARRRDMLTPWDIVVATAGRHDEAGGTNVLRVLTVSG